MRDRARRYLDLTSCGTLSFTLQYQDLGSVSDKVPLSTRSPPTLVRHPQEVSVSAPATPGPHMPFLHTASLPLPLYCLPPFSTKFILHWGCCIRPAQIFSWHPSGLINVFRRIWNFCLQSAFPIFPLPGPVDGTFSRSGQPYPCRNRIVDALFGTVPMSPRPTSPLVPGALFFRLITHVRSSSENSHFP